MAQILLWIGIAIIEKQQTIGDQQSVKMGGQHASTGQHNGH
jgi:hypothetical protein